MKNQQLYFLLGKILVHTFNRSEEMFGTILDVRVQEDPLYHDQWFVSIQWNGYQGVTEYHLVKAGDNILYGKYAGTELKYNGSDYMIMKESDILAIIK